MDLLSRRRPPAELTVAEPAAASRLTGLPRRASIPVWRAPGLDGSWRCRESAHPMPPGGRPSVGLAKSLVLCRFFPPPERPSFPTPVEEPRVLRAQAVRLVSSPRFLGRTRRQSRRSWPLLWKEKERETPGSPRALKGRKMASALRILDDVIFQETAWASAWRVTWVDQRLREQQTVKAPPGRRVETSRQGLEATAPASMGWRCV